MNNKTSIIIAGSVAAVILVFMIVLSLFKFGVFGGNTNEIETPSVPKTPPTITTRTVNCHKNEIDNVTNAMLTSSVNMSFENDILLNYSSNNTYQFSNIEDYDADGASLKSRLGTSDLNGISVTVSGDEAQYLYIESFQATESQLKTSNLLPVSDYSYQSLSNYYVGIGFSCQ